MAFVIAMMLAMGGFDPLEHLVYRLLFQLRGAIAWDDRLVLVTIDDASIRQLGRFPWPRQRYVQLLNTLSDAEAGVVVIDLIWSEPSPDDDSLAVAMAEQGKVVLAQAWDKTGTPLVPVRTLAEAAIATGHVMKRADADNLIRHVYPQVQGQPALSIAALQVYSLVKAPVTLPPPDRPLWINWVGPMSRAHSYSFADVIQGKIPIQAFRSKIVLVGVTATGLDSMVTPFDSYPAAGSVILHATIIQNLLQQSTLRPLWGDWLWTPLLTGAFGLSWLLSGWSIRRQLAVVVGLCSGWMLLSIALFRANYWLPVTPPIILTLGTAGTVALTERIRENYLLCQQIDHIWRRYCQDLVVISNHADVLSIPPRSTLQAQNSISRVAQLAELADQLGRSQSTQATIARTLSVGLLAADLDGTVWFCNPVATAWLMVMVGDPLERCMVPAWLTAQQWQTSLTCLKAGEEIKFRDLPYDDRWFDLQFQPLTYPHSNQITNSPNGLLLLLEDVTDRKQTQLDLQRAKEIAQFEAARSAEASRAKSEFLANMSHELRTPLNVILGFTQVMSHDKSLSQDHLNSLSIINRSGQHLLGLINDVLDMTKIETGKLKLTKTQVDLHHLIRDVESMMRVKAHSKNLTLIVELAPNVPQFIVTDEGRLRQVLLNLISNAVKFTHQGYVALRVFQSSASESLLDYPNHLLQSSPPDESLMAHHQEVTTLHFEVEDTGVGIAPEELNCLFQPFEQTKSGQQANEGTGLGLAISRKYIRLMGGDITVSSEVNRGSIFRFSIQVNRLTSISGRSLEPDRRVIALAPDQPVYRILIVEDRWENRCVLNKMLAPLGFDIREAKDGYEGLEHWQQWQPHLILMDIRMPGIDGYEVIRQIRLRESNLSQTVPRSPTKIIILTASVAEGAEIEGLGIGGDDFLRKPVQEATLLSVVAKHLGVRYLYEEVSPALESYQQDTPATIAELSAELAQMPTKWVKELQVAAIKGLDDTILQLVEQIPDSHSTLKQVITVWVHDFYFDRILEVIQHGNTDAN